MPPIETNEWYVVGEYKTERPQEMSVPGRLGDIRGRPNEQDLKEIEEKVKGLLRTWGISKAVRI